MTGLLIFRNRFVHAQKDAMLRAENNGHSLLRWRRDSSRFKAETRCWKCLAQYSVEGRIFVKVKGPIDEQCAREAVG